VLNCTGFPNGFTKKVLFSAIPDNATMTDNIIIGGVPGNLNDISVFLDIQHQKIADLTVKLKAPNNTEVILFAAQGGTSANGILAVLDDSLGNVINGTTYLSPWTQWVKPQNVMGTFGGTALNGTWVLTITDGAATNTGTLLGWGIRFNNTLIVGSQNISSTIPGDFNLHQNYPNPFNPVTKIKFEVPSTELVKIAVFDILGREIKTVVNSKLSSGIYEYEFDGSSLSSGVYFYKMQAGKFNDVKKMMIIK
jgi:subtilisin-like proprotein convertase family protein